TFPFPISLYGTSFTSANVSSNGNLQFTGNTPYGATNCPLPDFNLGVAVLLYQGDLYTIISCVGIFTSVTGTAPNRIFNIEWRAQYFPGTGNAGFELRLYEGQTRFDVIYGTVSNGK